MSENVKPFRPMLAFDASIEFYAESLSTHKRPWYASPKIDGMRAIVINGELRTRSMKLVPNMHTRALFGRKEFEGLDGELVVGDPFGDGVFARTSSGVMSRDGTPNVQFHIVDEITPNLSFYDRLFKARNRVTYIRTSHDYDNIHLVDQRMIETAAQLEVYEQECLDEGYEGLILKDPFGHYKQNRSTKREGLMGKLKRFQDGEAVITGLEEMLRNSNDPQLNERGYQVRSSKLQGQIPAGMLGAFQVMDCSNPSWVFHIGSGMDHGFRHHVWNNKDLFMGQILCYKYLPVGTLDLPRHPVFKGMRHKSDII